MAILKEYDAKLDSKQRLTLRGAEYQYYNVKTYDDGHIELSPRVLVDPQQISAKTVEMMDKAISNYKVGKYSAPIDIDSFAAEEP